MVDVADRVTMTHQDWLAEGERRFGQAGKLWRFRCPICGHVASVQDWHEAGISKEAAIQRAPVECIGRVTAGAGRAFGTPKPAKGGPCDYAAFGLFRVAPVTLQFPDGKEVGVFAFADAEDQQP